MLTVKVTEKYFKYSLTQVQVARTFYNLNFAVISEYGIL